MSVKVSIIIPCYNSEATLEATLKSVVAQNFQHWEAIIVNDGSTDDTEAIALNWVKKDNRFQYLSKANEGLGKTRNFGIEKARGTYILPLDSDNLVATDFAQDALAVLEENPQIGVVYGHARYFGEKQGLWEVEAYDFKKILAANYIDACAIYRKKWWIEVGGYDENMPYQGHEDWDFWIALGVLKVQFYHLNKITFHYYVSKKSMIRSFNASMQQANNDYIFKKYSEQCQQHYLDLFLLYQNAELQRATQLKSEKFVIDLFCKTFFGFSIFGLYKTKK